MRALAAAIVGCGNISRSYGKWLRDLDQTDFVGAFDLVPERAEKLAAEFGGRPYSSLEDLLADERVEAVLNLTIEREHAGVTTRCLQGGKHVYSEKPIALSHREATALIELAEARGLHLACAPSLFLGAPEQTAWKLVREGRLGDVKLVYADLNWGRLEAWHPAPAPYYQVGPLWNVAVYSMTTLTTIFGPARRVQGYGRIVLPERTLKDGTTFTVSAPDFFVAIVELASGTIVRVTTNFYVEYEASRQKQVEMHGDLGSLYYADGHDDDPRVELAPLGSPYERIPVLEKPYELNDWAAGVVDFAESVTGVRTPRLNAHQAAHLVEVFEALTRSVAEERPVDVTSTFRPQAPMDWALA
jgi:predicted dehydrogenase